MLARSATQDRYFLCLAEFPSKQVISEEGVADVAGIQPGPGCMQGVMTMLGKLLSIVARTSGMAMGTKCSLL